jgi:hypothetical protein
MARKLQRGIGKANHGVREPKGRPADNSRVDAELRGHGNKITLMIQEVNLCRIIQVQ